MPKLTIVAHVTANADAVDVVKSELEKLIAPSRNDAGCLQYDFHQDNDDPAYFMFYENWTSRELWQAHMETPHLKAYQAAVDGMIAEFSLHEMTHLEPGEDGG